MSIPSLGYLFDDNAKAIRLVSGIPGAAQLDLPVSIDGALVNATISSRGRVAIATLKSGDLALVDWNGAPRLVNLESGLGPVRGVSITRSGASVAITDGVNVEVWSLRNTPTKTGTLTPEGGAQGVALHGNGLLAIATPGGVDVVNGTETHRILSGLNASAVSFFSNGDDLLVASGGAVQIVRDVRKSAGSTSAIPVDGDVSALAISADGAWAAASLKEDVVLLDLTQNTGSPLQCACRSPRFDLLTGNLVLAATDIRSGSLIVLNLGATPTLARVPEFGGIAQ